MPANPTTRADVSEWILTALLAANLFWTTLCLGGYLPQTLVVTGSLTAALLVVHLLERAQLSAFFRRSAQPGGARPARAPFHPAGWWMLPFLGYATINVLWITPVRWLGWQDWFCWVQLIVVFWVVLNGIHARGPRQVLLGTLLLLGFVSVGLACYQRFEQPDWLMLGRVQAGQFFGRASGPFGIPNSLAGLLLLLIPPCGALAFRRDSGAAQRVFFGWLAVVLGFGLLLTISRGGWIALGLALSVWPMFSRRWSLRRRIAVVAGTLVLVVGVGAVLFRASPKVRERLVAMMEDAGERSRPIMWRAGWKIFLASPVLGSGAGSYNILFEKHRPDHQQAEPKWTHNDYLNTLSDYGIVGFTLFFGAAGAIAWRALRSRTGESARQDFYATAPALARLRRTPVDLVDDRRLHTAFAIGLLAFCFQLFVEFHFKIPALILASATVAAITVGGRWRISGEGELVTASPGARPAALPRVICAAMALAVAAGAAVWNTPRMRAEGIRYPLRRELDGLARRSASTEERREVARRAQVSFTTAVTLDPANAQAWADRAYATSILGHEDPEREVELGKEAEADARNALRGSTVVSEFWVRLGVALDMQHRWNDAGPSFSEALKLAPIRATSWFYQAYHFALNPVTQPLARSAVATCLRLDPSLREADALRRHLTGGR